ncbi:MAG TPA: hypothetical protein VFA59_20435 [Vicinamibacterales bacterium]|nr:hypothetical protein [Vicinamibacterales bacterium]
MAAARWAQQELLDLNPEPVIRVYAVWFNMYPSDAREKWPSTLLVDPRVMQYWDEARAVGARYLSALPSIVPRRAAATLPPITDAPLWDAYFVYPPGDLWREPVPIPAVWGYPIMVTRNEALSTVKALLSK